MLKIFADKQELFLFAARKFVEIANAAIVRNGRFSVALAGGSTPKSLYQLLAGEQFKDKIDWSKVFFFFGDERDVLPDEDESNYKMANESLFEPLKIDERNIFRWQTEIEPTAAIAEKYAAAVGDFFAPQDAASLPRFDLILLGMGADGHTASLFPFSDALGETEKIAVVNRVEKLDSNRLTLTFPVINHAADVMFLVAGADKAAALREVLEGEYQPEKFPSQSVEPVNGELFWLADDQAAHSLEQIPEQNA